MAVDGSFSPILAFKEPIFPTAKRNPRPQWKMESFKRKLQSPKVSPLPTFLHDTSCSEVA